MLVALMFALVMPSGFVSAAQATPTATARQAAPGVVGAPTASPVAAVASPDPGKDDGVKAWWRDAWLPLAILVFASLVIWGLLFFVRKTFSSSIGGLLDLAKSGKAVTPVFVNSTAQAGRVAGFAPAGGPGDALVITGMNPVVVGTPQTFSAAAASGVALTDSDVSWSSTAEGDLAHAIAIQPAIGQNVTVTAFKPGSFVLTATHADAANVSPASLAVSAVDPAPEGTGISIPFFGHGYGSQVMAIVLMALATILAVRGIFGTGEVAVLFGAIAGYIFGVAKQGGGDTGG